MSQRWFTENDDSHSQWYADHFRELSADGVDISGEARLLDAIVPPGSFLLDAGCGQGRTAGALFTRGHNVVGIDIDETLLQAARVDHPGPTYVRADLASLELPGNDGQRQVFDGAISAGNVITYVTPGTEVEVLKAIYGHLRADAPFLVGFHTERYHVATFDQHASMAGFAIDQRFATWDLRPWNTNAQFVVTLLRRN
jgi:2-polyprenyl-3-methyl-5-hydroxy-6-metoxy-1,4-benzoquinol methylase